jgi:hypothetical protein
LSEESERKDWKNINNIVTKSEYKNSIPFSLSLDKNN